MDKLTIKELKVIAKKKGLKGYSGMKKKDLVFFIKGGSSFGNNKDIIKYINKVAKDDKPRVLYVVRESLKKEVDKEKNLKELLNRCVQNKTLINIIQEIDSPGLHLD